MKKIPTLFKRLYCEDGAVILTREVTEGMEWVLSRRKKEQGVATVKWDGAACAISDGEPKCKIKRSDFGFKWPPNQ